MLSLVMQFHFVLSLGAVIAIFSGIMYFQDKISGPGTLPTSTSYISRYHFIMPQSSTNNNGMSVRKYNCWSRHRDADVEFCLPTINSISTMNRHDVVGVRKEKVILIALNCEPFPFA